MAYSECSGMDLPNPAKVQGGFVCDYCGITYAPHLLGMSKHLLPAGFSIPTMGSIRTFCNVNCYIKYRVPINKEEFSHYYEGGCETEGPSCTKCDRIKLCMNPEVIPLAFKLYCGCMSGEGEGSGEGSGEDCSPCAKCIFAQLLTAYIRMTY